MTNLDYVIEAVTDSEAGEQLQELLDTIGNLYNQYIDSNLDLPHLDLPHLDFYDFETLSKLFAVYKKLIA